MRSYGRSTVSRRRAAALSALACGQSAPRGPLPPLRQRAATTVCASESEEEGNVHPDTVITVSMLMLDRGGQQMRSSSDPEPLPADSVVGQLRPFVWSSEEAVAFEVAIEDINRVVAVTSGLIAAEKARPAPDEDKIAQWTAIQVRCVQEQQRLRSTDHAAVARVRREYSALARELRGETG